jgi:hypothetical protein
MARTRLRGLEIAGIQIGIEVPGTCPWQWPDEEVARFSCLPRDPEVHVGVRYGDVDRQPLMGMGECYALGSWTFEVARRGGDWILGLSRDGRREQVALFEEDFRAGEVVLSRDLADQAVYPLRGPLDEWIVLHRSVAAGGLCLNATASAEDGGARVRLGRGDVQPIQRGSTPSTAIFGRNTLLLREVAGQLRVHRTPWGDAMDRSLAADARVIDLCQVEETIRPYRECLDPDDGAELLVTHAVVPLCDEGLFDRVLRNAQRMAQSARVSRVGESRTARAPMAWQSMQIQSAFAPPRGAI